MIYESVGSIANDIATGLDDEFVIAKDKGVGRPSVPVPKVFVFIFQ